MKIVVKTEEMKQDLINQSRYIHDQRISVDGCSTFAHLYLAPHLIVVDPEMEDE